MKKLFLILTLAVILSGIPSSLIVLAQHSEIPNCCILSETIKIGDKTYDKGDIVGHNPDGGHKCNVKNNDIIDEENRTKQWGLLCLMASIKAITEWVFRFLIVFVGVMVIFGAFTLVTSAGDPQKVKSGRNYILYACIGMIAGFLAKAVPTFLLYLFFGE